MEPNRRKGRAHLKKSYEMDLCRGPLLRQILQFAFPLVCSGVLQLLFNAADVVIVGRFAGSTALAAVGSTTSLIALLVNFFIGISVGVNVLVARFYGGNDWQDARETVQTALVTAVAGGLLLTCLGLGVSGPMLTLMGTPGDVLDQAVLYMRLYFLGMPATLLFNFGAAALRAVGDTRRPLYFLTLSGLVNVGFNLFFVISLHMGVAGVATATVIAQYLSGGLILLCLSRTEGVCRVDLRRLTFSKEKLKRMLQTGLPAGIQSSIFSIANVLIQSSVNSFGATVMAGNAAASNLEGFVYIAMNALYQTCLSFTSQNLGAQKFRRIDQVLVRCALIVAVIGLILGNGARLLGGPLLGIYSSDPEVISFGILRLSVVASFYFLCGLMEVVSGSVRGLGYSLLPTLVSLAGACLLRIIWVFTVFQHFHTLFSLYLSWPVSWALTVTVHLICYAFVRRKVFDMEKYAGSA